MGHMMRGRNGVRVSFSDDSIVDFVALSRVQLERHLVIEDDCADPQRGLRFKMYEYS
jgi:hypothetical protein